MYPLDIHSWGGLGSQLYALAVAHEAQSRFPTRSIRLVVHSGGITHRRNELSEISSDFNVIEKDDFSGGVSHQTRSQIDVSSNLVIRARMGFKSWLRFSGVLASANTQEEFTRIKPWVKTLRGHYSNLDYSLPSLKYVVDKLNSYESQIISDFQKQEFHAIHYRLGDLITHANKPNIELARLGKVIGESKINTNDDPVLVFSDSPSEALRRLDGFIDSKRMIYVESNTHEVLALISRSKTFLGTNSKISVWGAILKDLCGDTNDVHLPQEIRHHLSCLSALNGFNQINFY